MATGDETVERVFPSGAWRVSNLVHGYYVTRQYMGFTKREAVAMFRREARALRGVQ